ncbi:leucine-rich repeat protein kinase family protein [Striga asiatica]|uniref:Leucine-rich repeat protein kinase family protein n=1 Tax=Striga asiatica TaxID=4170 RepID=A0A5A7PRS3_STRAF|nr:leucine-rich repeat protein kinase family protein [Striga asiatica]
MRQDNFYKHLKRLAKIHNYPSSDVLFLKVVGPKNCIRRNHTQNREVTPGRHQAKFVKLGLRSKNSAAPNDLRCRKFLKEKARSQLVARLARSKYRGLEADLSFVARCKMAMTIECSVPALMNFFCLGA